MKKKVKKVKIKNILIALFVLIIIGLLIYFYLNSHIKNIYISGNNYFSEQEIIELAGIKDYPKYYKINKEKIKNNLLKEDLIDNVSISLSFDLKLTIKIEENKALCFDDINKKIILSDGNRIDNKYNFIGLPILSNTISEEVYDRFIKSFNKIDDDILNKISEIKYEPSELDKDRFLLYMNDQIYVYITLTKIETLNNYNKIVEELDGKKGILYLDSGNHFQIKDKTEEKSETE